MEKTKLKNTEEYVDRSQEKDSAQTDEKDSTSDFKKKIDNYFYHYKWHTIIGAFLVFVVIWVAITSIGKNTEQVYVGYIGEYSYSNEQHREKSEKLTSMIGDVLGKDILIEYSPLFYITDEQIKVEKEKAESKGEQYVYYPERIKKNYDSFVSELEMGDIGVWFVSMEVYERMDKSRLMRVEDILGYSPDSVYDEYAIDCSKIDFPHQFARETSFNTLLILRGNRDWSSMFSEKEMMAELELDKTLFKAIIEYKK